MARTRSPTITDGSPVDHFSYHFQLIPVESSLPDTAFPDARERETDSHKRSTQQVCSRWCSIPVWQKKIARKILKNRKKSIFDANKERGKAPTRAEMPGKRDQYGSETNKMINPGNRVFGICTRLCNKLELTWSENLRPYQTRMCRRLLPNSFCAGAFSAFFSLALHQSMLFIGRLSRYFPPPPPSFFLLYLYYSVMIHCSRPFLSPGRSTRIVVGPPGEVHLRELDTKNFVRRPFRRNRFSISLNSTSKTHTAETEPKPAPGKTIEIGLTQFCPRAGSSSCGGQHRSVGHSGKTRRLKNEISISTKKKKVLRIKPPFCIILSIPTAIEICYSKFSHIKAEKDFLKYPESHHTRIRNTAYVIPHL